jgi:hypothetical protein
MTYGRSLERWLKRDKLPIEFSEWSKLAQDQPKWRALITATCHEITAQEVGINQEQQNSMRFESSILYKRERYHRAQWNNKQARCVQAAVPVSFPQATGKLLVQFR